MFRAGFLRSAAVALELYGVLGLFIAAAMLVVGVTTFGQVLSLQRGLEAQRVSLVASIRSVSGTVHDTAEATGDFERSIDGARDSADAASDLANQTAGTFRAMANGLGVQVFGVQPFIGLAPQFHQSADQLQQLAISLGATRDALGQNGADVQRVGGDLANLQRQLEAVAAALDRPGVLGLDSQALLPFQVAFYGMCLLVLLQSAFSLVAGVALFRLSGQWSVLSGQLGRERRLAARPAPDGPASAHGQGTH